MDSVAFFLRTLFVDSRGIVEYTLRCALKDHEDLHR